ncbi:ABC transporter substrate-binding protein, partial [bacterium]|nr:ABC transporter substrate-binding protein [bacterium]
DGGVDGHPIEIVYEDDATDPDTAVAATTRLIDKEGVLAIIGATGTGSTMAMRQEVVRAGIPQVSPAGGTVITSDFNELVFQTPWSNSLVIPYELAYIKDQGITKIALISDSGGFGKDGAAVVKAKAAAAGMTITADEVFNAGDADMSAQLTKIKGSGAEAVLMVTAGKEAAIVAKNMKDLAMTIPLFGTHGNARKEFIEGAGPAAEGFKFAAGKILLPDAYGTDTEGYDVATDFIARYTDEFGKAPDTFAGHAYDALYIIVNAMKTLDEGFTPGDLRDAIEKTSGFVGIGGTFTYSATDHNGMSESDLVMYQVKNGEWVLAE